MWKLSSMRGDPRWASLRYFWSLKNILNEQQQNINKQYDLWTCRALGSSPSRVQLRLTGQEKSSMGRLWKEERLRWGRISHRLYYLYIRHNYPLSLPLSCSMSPQVNNATARVVTKKPQTPIVNGEISSKTRIIGICTFHFEGWGILGGFCL